MKKNYWVRLFAVVAVVGLFAAACDSDDDSSSTSTGDESTTTTEGGSSDNEALTYGKLLPETGDLSAIIGALSTPIDIATDEINAAGGVNGADVEVISADSGTDPDIASAAADQLLADNVDVILGAAASGVSVAIVDKVTSEGVVMCSGSNTSPELTDIEDDGYYFRTAPPDKLQGPAMAELLASDGITNVAIIARNDSYGVGFTDAIKEAFEAAGGTVSAEVAYDPEGTNFDAEAQEVVDAGAEAVVLIGFNDDGGLVEQALIQAGAGPADIPTYMADGTKSSSFFEAVDPADAAVLVGVRGTAPAAAPGGTDHPFEAVYAETGEDTIFSSYFYDCTIITALAAQSAGSNDPTAIRDAIADILTGDNACKEFAECKQLLEDGETINYDGASGPLDFSDVGEPQRGVYDVWEYDAEGADTTVEGADQIVIDETEADPFRSQRRVARRVANGARKTGPRLADSCPSVGLGEGPQVELDDLGVVQQLSARSRVRVRTLVEHVATIGDEQAAPGVLFHHHDGGAGGVDRGDTVEHVVLHRGGQPRRRLIEEQDRRLRHQRTRHGEPLAFTARQRTGTLAPSFGDDRKVLGELVHPPFELTRREECAHPQVVLDGEGAEHVQALGHVADAQLDELVSGRVRDVVVAQMDRSCPHTHEPEESLEQRRLAGAVRADDADQLTVGGFE